MKRDFAQFLSVVLHPVLMPTYALIFIFRHNSYFSYTVPDAEKLQLYLIVVLNTLVFPVLISYILLKRGWIKSFEMEEKEERLFPYITNLLFLLVAAYMIYTLDLPRVFFLLLIGASMAVAGAVILNFKWKISIHMIGMGCIIGTFLGLSSLMLVDLRMAIIFALLISGLLGTARLSLSAHSSSQIYAGFFLGFICEYLVFTIN